MSGYKLNRPIIAGVETKWYRLLKAIYASGPMVKKDWLSAAEIHFTDTVTKHWSLTFKQPYFTWSYRHWRGLYPDLFSKLRRLHLVEYNRKQNLWHPNYDALRTRFPALKKLTSFEESSS